MMRMTFYVSSIFLLIVITFAKDEEFQRYFSKNIRLDPNTVVFLRNPVGEVHISTSKDPVLTVKQKIYAMSDELAKSRMMVNMVRLDPQRKLDTLLLNVLFPFHMYQKFSYPPMGGFLTTSVLGKWDGIPIEVASRGGMKLWSDIYLFIPEGHKVTIQSIAAVFILEDFQGDLELTADHVSFMCVGNNKGNLWVSACYGGVSVSNFSGSIFYDSENAQLSFCDTVRGTVYAKSNGGDILWTSLTDTLYRLELESINGEIDIKGDIGDTTLIVTERGSINLELDFVKELLNAFSKDGDIKLTIPRKGAQNLLAYTSQGKLKHNLSGYSGDDKKIQVTLGGTSGNIGLKTENGSIKLKVR